MKIYERWLRGLLSSAPCSRVLARLAQIGELARRLDITYTEAVSKILKTLAYEQEALLFGYLSEVSLARTRERGGQGN